MTSLYTRLVSGLLFPLQEQLKHHDSVRVREQLERSQWDTPAVVLQKQAHELRDFLIEIGNHVPYYRDLFRQQGIDPSTIDSVDKLVRIPVLTKALIRANVDAMKHPAARGLQRSNTGGSSGEPLVFYIGNERVSHDVAAKWRATRWWGVDIGDPEIVVWGSPIELGAQDRMRLLRDSLMRTKLLPAFEMSTAKLDGFVRQIRAMRPKMLFGYPSSISHIARHAEERGIAMNDLGIKVAFVTSECLYEHQREMIERVFGCPVANGYGGRDAGFIAHQCPSGGMHITAEDIVVELLDEDGQPVADGMPGEVTVTHLRTRDFPFVRYRTGDVAIRDAGHCSCGRGLPLLREIQGRTTDFLLAQDGTVMHGLALVYVVREIEGIDSFKIVQETLHLTRLQVVRPAGLSEAMLAQLRAGFKSRLGADVVIEIELVDVIPAQGNGKYRYVVSKLR